MPLIKKIQGFIQKQQFNTFIRLSLYVYLSCKTEKETMKLRIPLLLIILLAFFGSCNILKLNDSPQHTNLRKVAVESPDIVINKDLKSNNLIKNDLESVNRISEDQIAELPLSIENLEKNEIKNNVEVKNNHKSLVSSPKKILNKFTKNFRNTAKISDGFKNSINPSALLIWVLIAVLILALLAILIPNLLNFIIALLFVILIIMLILFLANNL